MSGYGIGSSSSQHVDGLATSFEYDDSDRQTVVHRHLSEAAANSTCKQYDRVGRVRLEMEGCNGTTGQRYTAYGYDENGRLTGIAAITDAYFSGTPTWDIDWEQPSSADIQITRLEYGADVVDSGWAMPAFNGGWSPTLSKRSEAADMVKKVTYPNGDELLFSYYADGLVATRADSRGVKFYHAYDALGRRTETWIDDQAYFGGMLTDWTPTDRVQRVQFQYDPSGGELARVTAYWYQPMYPSGWSETIVADNEFHYDALRNLTAEYQQHFAAVDSYSRHIDYTWDYADAANGNYVSAE